MCLSVQVSHFDLIGYSDNTMQDTEDVAIYRLQTKLRQGIVFTPVCDSVHRGRSLSRGVSVREIPLYSKERAVCILLDIPVLTAVLKKCLN